MDDTSFSELGSSVCTSTTLDMISVAFSFGLVFHDVSGQVGQEEEGKKERPCGRYRQTK